MTESVQAVERALDVLLCFTNQTSELTMTQIASIAVAGPAYRLTRERMMEIGPGVAAIAREISQEIRLAAIPGVNSSIRATAESGNKR